MRLLGNDLVYGHGSDWPGRWYLCDGITTDQVMVAMQPLGAPDEAHSYLNINNVMDYMLHPVSPIWDPSYGWSFNGIDQYVNAGLSGGTTYNLGPGTSVLVRFSDMANEGHVYGSMGNETLWTARWALCPHDTTISGGNVFWRCGMNAITQAPAMDGGVAGATYHNAYRSGIKVGTSSENDVLWPAQNLYVGARNRFGTAEMFGQCKVQLIATYNVSLTDAQMLTISQQMSAVRA